MDLEKKKELKRNLIKFIIGIILLTFCWFYIQQNPAEKVSLFSGFQIIFQKIEVIYNDFLGNSGELIKRRQALEKYYNELINTANAEGCLSDADLDMLVREYENLKKETNESLPDNLPYYSRSSYEYEDKIEKACEKEFKF